MKLEWWADHRDGEGKQSKRLIVGSMPTIPARMALIRAYQAALGLELQEDTLEPVREPDGDDLVAVAYATLGLCWAQPSLDLPTLRECGRDVVDYGERVQTVIMEGGYSQEGLIEQARGVLQRVEQSTYRAMGLVEEAAEDFEEAQD